MLRRVGLYGSTGKLLGLVERLALQNKETERAVRFTSDAKNRYLWEGFSAKVYRGPILRLGVYADDCARIPAGERTGCRAAGIIQK